ncbi:hypothetical protein ACS0TY_023684 [Phlomoides rotata]
MQLSYDPRGSSIPTILLFMQRHLYSQGGLQAGGIFRGVIPGGIDVHCLAGLIKEERTLIESNQE